LLKTENLPEVRKTVILHPMSNTINLNAFRKQKARAVKRAQADENSVKFGRTKAQKELEKAQQTKAKAVLDGHKTGNSE
jgi:hypothetical protein